MRTRFFLFFGMALASAALPCESEDLKFSDVARFERNAQTCEHLAGEWDPDMSKPARRTIEANVDRYCGAAQKQRQSLLIKYKNNDSVMKKLAQYESVASYLGKRRTHPHR